MKPTCRQAARVPHGSQHEPENAPTARYVGYEGLFSYLGGRYSLAALRLMKHRRAIPYVQVSPRRTLFDLREIDAWMRSRSVAATA